MALCGKLLSIHKLDYILKFEICQEISMIRYKKNVLQALKAAGYNTYRLQKEKLIAAGTTQKLRRGDTNLTIENLDTICSLLHCQPGDLLEWYPADDAE